MDPIKKLVKQITNERQRVFNNPESDKLNFNAMSIDPNIFKNTDEEILNELKSNDEHLREENRKQSIRDNTRFWIMAVLTLLTVLLAAFGIYQTDQNNKLSDTVDELSQRLNVVERKNLLLQSGINKANDKLLMLEESLKKTAQEKEPISKTPPENVKFN